MIEFENIQKSYEVQGKRIPALEPINLRIERGEIFGIIGHSGAGKSTLVRLINLLEPPSGGRLLLDGDEVTRLDAAELRAMRRQVSMIFQHFNLLSSKTWRTILPFP